MSGRIYESRSGIPICDKCGSYSLRSEQTNFNGSYCLHCKNKSQSFTKFDENHPLWTSYLDKINEDQGKLVIVESFGEFAKKSRYKL